jgi:hypothetical protein
VYGTEKRGIEDQPIMAMLSQHDFEKNIMEDRK